MSNFPKLRQPSLMEITPYKPGKSSISGKKDAIKLSSNENPFGSSPKVQEAIKQSTESIHRYPDGSSTKLREAIGNYFNIETDNIVCGLGSDEILTLLAQSYAGEGDEIIYTKHGFLIYPIAAYRVGAKPVAAPEVNLKASIPNIISSVSENTRIVYIANPNNPTGSYLNSNELLELRNKLRDDILLVIDEAYAEYAEDIVDDYTSGFELVKNFNNVVVTRTFSKIFGMGGMRLGWGYSNPEIIDVLNRMRGPFNISSTAQMAGIAALEDKDFIEKSKQHNSKWLKIMASEISDLGYKTFPTIANFILVSFGDETNAITTYEYLLKNGIITRKMSAYHLPDCLRITIGTEDDNKAVINALKLVRKLNDTKK